MAPHSSRGYKTPSDATAFDWMLLVLITVIGGSSFAMIRTAVETVEPQLVAVGRLWVGAAIVYALMKAKGRKLPRLVVATQKGPRLHKAWAFMIAGGFMGYTLPFLLFPYAQQYLDSGLAGVYMAFMPIWTIGLAYLFAGESLTPRKLAGFGLGFVGVAILMGPEALKSAGAAALLPQISLLFATFCYAVYAVMTRRAPPIRPRAMAAGVIMSGAAIATPILFFVDLDPSRWSLLSIVNIVGLGVFPTGLAGVLLIMLIKRAGAGFMSFANYLTPIWAVAVGAAVFGERLPANAFLALAVTLAAVAVSRSRPVKPPATARGDHA